MNTIRSLFVEPSFAPNCTAHNQLSFNLFHPLFEMYATWAYLYKWNYIVYVHVRPHFRRILTIQFGCRKVQPYLYPFVKRRFNLNRYMLCNWSLYNWTSLWQISFQYNLMTTCGEYVIAKYTKKLAEDNSLRLLTVKQICWCWHSKIEIFQTNSKKKSLDQKHNSFISY